MPTANCCNRFFRCYAALSRPPLEAWNESRILVPPAVRPGLAVINSTLTSKRYDFSCLYNCLRGGQQNFGIDRYTISLKFSIFFQCRRKTFWFLLLFVPKVMRTAQDISSKKRSFLPHSLSKWRRDASGNYTTLFVGEHEESTRYLQKGEKLSKESKQYSK